MPSLISMPSLTASAGSGTDLQPEGADKTVISSMSIDNDLSGDNFLATIISCNKNAGGTKIVVPPASELMIISCLNNGKQLRQPSPPVVLRQRLRTARYVMLP